PSIEIAAASREETRSRYAGGRRLHQALDVEAADLFERAAVALFHQFADLAAERRVAEKHGGDVGFAVMLHEKINLRQISVVQIAAREDGVLEDADLPASLFAAGVFPPMPVRRPVRDAAIIHQRMVAQLHIVPSE